MKKVKIKTDKGRIITLDIEKETETHLMGPDKFGEYTIIAKSAIQEMLPIRC